MDLTKLLDNKSWEKAIIVFSNDNFKGYDYTERSRSYRVSRADNYFHSEKISTSLHGYCLDGTDQGVRLDHYRWKVEKVMLED